MSTTTQNLGLYKPELSDIADITKLNENWDKIDEKLVESQRASEVFTAVGTHNQYTGSKYAVTVPGLTELYPGLKLTIIPDSTSVINYCKLNVNDLGEYYLVQPISSDTASAKYGSGAEWIQANYPIDVMFDGKMWRVLNITVPDATKMVGVVPIKNGGTGVAADTAAEALAALGGVSKTLVWENTAIETDSAEFAAQSIPIDNIETYDGFEIAYVDNAGSQFHLYSTGFIPNYRNQMINLSVPLLDKIAVRGCRMSGTGIFMFEADYREYATATTVEDDHYCIPYKIYGIKGVVQGGDSA